MNFSEALKTAMEKRNWRPIHLAAALSDRGDAVHTVTIERWADGSSEPTISRARLIADIVGISIDSLSVPNEPTNA